MNPVVAALVVQAVLIVLLLAAGAGLYRRVRELELATFRGIGLSLTATASGVSALTAGRRAVVVKINRRCPVCEDILGAIDLASAQLPADTDVVVVSDDPHVSWRSSGRVRVVPTRRCGAQSTCRTHPLCWLWTRMEWSASVVPSVLRKC